MFARLVKHSQTKLLAIQGSTVLLYKRSAAADGLQYLLSDQRLDTPSAEMWVLRAVRLRIQLLCSVTVRRWGSG
jgi:hypothetical protein